MLEQFTCTAPAPKGRQRRPLPHPRPWEREVQSAIRTQRLGEARVLLGFDNSQQLVAVTAHGPYSSPTLPIPQRLIAVVAVSVSVRGQGGAIADEAIEYTLADILSLPESAQADSTIVLAGVHVKNQPCEALLIRHGFQLLFDTPDSNGLRPWVIEVDATTE